MSSDSNAGNYFDLNFIKNLKNLNGNHGYLVCHKCYGYYSLKENELPDDFLECECGNDLEFYENIEDFIKTEGLENLDETNSELLHDNELQEISNVLKSKSEKRKEFLKNLATRIKMQEEVLNEINYGKGKFWDTNEEKRLYNGINAQNFTVEKEDNFLSYVKEKRSRAERTENHYFMKIIAILFVISSVMLLTLFL
jgi:hypothetical protein